MTDSFGSDWSLHINSLICGTDMAAHLLCYLKHCLQLAAGCILQKNVTTGSHAGQQISSRHNSVRRDGKLGSVKLSAASDYNSAASGSLNPCAACSQIVTQRFYLRLSGRSLQNSVSLGANSRKNHILRSPYAWLWQNNFRTVQSVGCGM